MYDDVVNLLFVGNIDPSNVSNRNARAINRCNGKMRARVVTNQRHPFGYEEDIVLHRDGKDGTIAVRALLAEADWIIHTGDSDYERMFKLLRCYKVYENDPCYRWATRHGGTPFRSRPDYYGELDVRLGFELRLTSHDLYRFTKNDSRARVYSHAQDHVLKTLPALTGTPIVCHTPSNPSVKHTDMVVEAMSSVDTCFHVWRGSFEEVSAKRAACHIYVDQVDSIVGGFGAAAMEAMAAGLVVVGELNHIDPATAAWIPPPPILPVRSVADIERVVGELVSDLTYLEAQRQASLAWAQTYLTDAFTYNYWATNLRVSR